MSTELESVVEARRADAPPAGPADDANEFQMHSSGGQAAAEACCSGQPSNAVPLPNLLMYACGVGQPLATPARLPTCGVVVAR